MQVNPVPTRNLVKQMEAEGVGITYAEFPNLNHMMQHAISGNVREYFDIEETLAVEVYIKTCSWLLDRARMR
jgi:hypothetical protein